MSREQSSTETDADSVHRKQRKLSASFSNVHEKHECKEAESKQSGSNTWRDNSIEGVRKTLARLYLNLDSPATEALPAQERRGASASHCSLLFGEVAFDGVTKMLDHDHLNASDAQSIVDLGAGCGRLAMQAFLLFPLTQCVQGVELSATRCSIAFTALKRLSEEIQSQEQEGYCSFEFRATEPRSASLYVPLFQHQGAVEFALCEEKSTKHSAAASSNDFKRELSFFEMSFFSSETSNRVARADIIVLETNILEEKARDLVTLLSHAKVGTRILTYNNLKSLYQQTSADFHWKRLAGQAGRDHYLASWGNARFFSYMLTDELQENEEDF